jgi:hypothetical protein
VSEEILQQGTPAAVRARKVRTMFMQAVRGGKVDLRLAVAAAGAGRDQEKPVKPAVIATENAIKKVLVIDFLRAMPRFEDRRAADAIVLRSGINPRCSLGWLAQRHPRGEAAIRALEAELAPRSKNRNLPSNWAYFTTNEAA